MAKRVVVLVTFSLLVALSTPQAFDGNRQGFVLGGGVGVSPRSVFEYDHIAGSRETHTAFGWNMIIGYGWSESNLLVYDINLAYYTKNNEISDSTILQGFVGPTWYHYWGKPGRALFTGVGLGFFRYLAAEGRENGTATIYGGAGNLFSVGYEFSRHFQLGLYRCFGFTHPNDMSASLSNWNILLTGVAF